MSTQKLLIIVGLNDGLVMNEGEPILESKADQVERHTYFVVGPNKVDSAWWNHYARLSTKL